MGRCADDAWRARRLLILASATFYYGFGETGNTSPATLFDAYDLLESTLGKGTSPLPSLPSVLPLPRPRTLETDGGRTPAKQTLDRHGQAWHFYRFYGRIRKWDGLIALVRVPVEDRGLGIYIFRGYLVGGQNLTGSWRAYASNPNAIPLEGPFIASKRADA